MNIGRAYPWILVGWLLICVTPAYADTQLSESTFQDWTGEMSESVLSDGSVLFEYTSRTFSGRVEGAMLALSFIPRFHCAPIFSIRLRAKQEAVINDPVLEVSFGSDVLTFEGFVDSDEDFLTYSILASSEQMEKLWQRLDESPRVTVNIGSGSSQGSSTPSEGGSLAETSSSPFNSIVFSLLGSKLASRSVQAHCQLHEPVKFQPK